MKKNIFLNVVYFHNHLYNKGYFEFIIDPFYSPKSYNSFMDKTLNETIFSFSLEKGYQQYVTELCKRSPKSKKEIETLLEKVKRQASEKVNDLMYYFVTHLDNYSRDEITRVAYGAADTFKGIKIVNCNRGPKSLRNYNIEEIRRGFFEVEHVLKGIRLGA